METRIIFREILSTIKNKADSSGKFITRDEIKELLKDIPLEEEHYELVYSYLKEQNIRVGDSREELEEELNEADRPEGLTLYAEEMIRLEKEQGSEDASLISRMLAGDQKARDELIHQYLPVICEMASSLSRTCRLPVEDLIQEGNLGLLMALQDLSRIESAAACHAHIVNSINDALNEAISFGEEQQKGAKGIVDRVNHLNEAVHNLEEELGRKVSAAELSAYLDMPLDEIADVLRMSGDQIELE